MAIIELLKKHSADYGINIDEALAQKLAIYGRLLREWNDKINLTAILDDEGIAVKHFLDCLLVGQYADFKAGDKIIDVGTGAGFPGLVIAAAYPECKVTLLDSTGKKLKAVADIAEKMGVTNVAVVHMRAEDAGKKPEFREQYDYATARAVAELRVLLEYTRGGKVNGTKEFSLPGGDKRAIINVKKISHIPPKYPRVSAQIAKKPL